MHLLKWMPLTFDIHPEEQGRCQNTRWRDGSAYPLYYSVLLREFHEGGIRDTPGARPRPRHFVSVPLAVGLARSRLQSYQPGSYTLIFGQPSAQAFQNARLARQPVPQ